MNQNQHTADTWSVLLQIVDCQQSGQSPISAAGKCQKEGSAYVDAALVDLMYQIIGNGVQKLEDAHRRFNLASSTRPTN